MLAEYRNSKFHSSIYRKPTFTGLAFNFYSYCPIKFKINAIKTLITIHRAYHLSSSYDLFSAEINYLTTFFSNNGYPVKLFETLTSQFLNSMKCGNETHIATVPKDTMYISLPYLVQISHELEFFLLNLLGRNYPQISYKFSSKNNFTIKSFFNYKDRMPAELCSRIIYKFECESCKDSYIGSTMKQSKVRFCEHLSISPRTNRPTTVSHSSPRQHCEEKNHPFQLSNFSIIDSANSELKLRILESLHILQKHPPLNRPIMHSSFFVQI